MPLGEIPDFSKKIATTRSRSVATTVLFQSIPALKERYPNDAHLGILGNTDLSVFLGTTDPLTADFVSKRGGETSVLVESHMESHNKFDLTRFTAEFRESSGVGKRMILTPDEVLTMGKDNPMQEIIVMKDQPILMCEKFDYTRDPESKKWEPFSMNDFNPRDSFWFDAVPEEGGVDEDSEPEAETPEPIADPPSEDNREEPVPLPDKPAPSPSSAVKKTAPAKRGRKEKEKDKDKPSTAPEDQQCLTGFFEASAKEDEIPAFLTPEDAADLSADSGERWPNLGEAGYKENGVEL